MLKFVIKRLLIAIPLLVCVAFLSFALIQLAPGDYFDALKTNPLISPETIQKYKDTYHLGEPVYTQFYYWFSHFVQGDWGYSFARKAPVLLIIKSYAFNTFVLAISALLLTWSISIPLGIMSAVKRNTFYDKFVSIVSLLGISFPSFVLAVLLLYYFSLIPGIPVGGMKSLQYDQLSFFGKIFDIAKHLIVPVLAISILSVASLIRITRANMLDVLRKPYILAAYARGLDNTTVYMHALRNAINPLITILGYEFSALLSGAAIIEIICNWPGLGSIMLEAVMSQDLFLVMGGIMIGSVMLIIGNLLADVLLVFTDPRIKL